MLHSSKQPVIHPNVTYVTIHICQCMKRKSDWTSVKEYMRNTNIVNANKMNKYPRDSIVIIVKYIIKHNKYCREFSS